MPYTNCKVHMEFIDTSAIADSTASSQDNAAIGSLPLLREEQAYPVYAIPDWNSFLLDGSRAIMPDTVKVPFLSTEISEDDCTFVKNPVLTVEFNEKHTSAGITLFFTGDYPAELKIYWYDLSGEPLVSQTYYPDSLKYFCKKQVDNYGKIVVEFIRTRLPGQRVQCSYIKYGTEIEWKGENVQKASVTEEVDVTSATVPINTAEISIVDETNDFELSNQEGVWKSIQKRQELTILEELTNKDVFCGTLYIDTWKSDCNVVSFSLIDLIGLMDKTKFYEGRIYENEAAGVLIAEVMESAGVENYIVSEEVSDILLTGYIPICTHREALQQVVFACGAVADCSRTGGINIYMPDRYADSTIGIDRKFMGTTLEIEEYVSGVSIAYKRYTLKEDAEEIYNDMLPAGASLIEFSDPYANVSLSAGEIVAVSTNYVQVNMTEASICVITGQKYESKEVTYTEKLALLDAGEEENVLSYDGCTLFNSERVKAVAQKLLNYYQLRQIVRVRYLLDTEKTGDWVNIMDTRGNMVTSGITSQTIDLTGGFIAEAICRGYSKVTTTYSYAGEFYAGEGGGV